MLMYRVSSSSSSLIVHVIGQFQLFCMSKERLLGAEVYVCMYVCMEVVLRGVTMEKAWEGEGPSKWVKCPNPAGTIGPALGTLAHICVNIAFCSQLYSGQLRVSCNLM